MGKGKFSKRRKQGGEKSLRSGQALGFESFVEFPLGSFRLALLLRVSLMAWVHFGVPGTLNAQGLGCVVILFAGLFSWCCLFLGQEFWSRAFFLMRIFT